MNGINDKMDKKLQNNHLKLTIPERNDIQTNGKCVDNIKKRKKRDKSDLGPNFIAPDGGWGWLVAVASGVNILVTFAVGQQFGIIFREHMFNLGISSSQLTTIINTQIAVSAFTGLLNGPLFRRYTYRQVALVGSFLSFLGLFLAVFAKSFLFYIVAFSCCYGFGRGLTVSASSLAVNTFFKLKRRTATAYQFGVAGLGPIVFPYLATFLLYVYGVEGTVLIFSGLCLHTIACSLIYQPVKWHTKTTAIASNENGNANEHDVEGYNYEISKGNDDHIEEEEIEQYAEPDTPILPRANDGWFGSRTSLHSRNRLNSLNSLDTGNAIQMYELKRLNSKDAEGKIRSFSVSESIKEEREMEDDDQHYDNHNTNKELVDKLEIDKEKELRAKEKALEANAKQRTDEIDEYEARKKLPFYKKIVIFFDLDLLRDITYVNLSVGLTLINFVEVNFAILTPFILSDFGFESHQIALAMSSLGFCDLVIRFLIPLITAKMKFSNQTFFVIGIAGMCAGRAVLATTRDFYVMLGVFIWLGLNKAFRTVFWSLIIAGYVPLKRLPAASGLQLLMSGIFSMICGPLIGIIRDKTNYSFTLNFLNSLCIFAISMWILESIIRKRIGKPIKYEGEK